MDAIHYASPDAPRRASLVAPAKSASAGARKSGQPASLAAAAGVLFQQQESRTARKTSGPRIYRDEEHPQSAYTVDKDADENTSPARSIAVKSSSATSPSIASIPAADTSSSSNNTKPFTHGAAVKTANTSASDESSSILAPLVQSRRGDKDNIASIPPGAHRPGFGKGKGRGKDYAPPAAGKGGKLLPFKRKAEENTSSDSLDRREGTDETEEDQSSSINVRSRSPRGYTWDVEVLEIKPEDVKHRISYHNSITTTIEREGKNERVRFRRGDKIWILPDPQWLPPVSHEVEINELVDDEWWVGEILDCCALDQESQQSGSLGLLRVAWYYSPDHAYTLEDLHSDWKKKIRKYRFSDPERIKSDHVDFVGIECFAGFADGIFTFLNISGLEVDDVERMKAPRHRKKSNRIVRMTGFTLKDTAQRAAAREAELLRNPGMARRVKRGQDDRSSRRRLEPIQADDDSEHPDDAYNYD